MSLIPGPRRAYFVIAAIGLVADQGTKLMANLWLRPRGTVVVIPDFFNLSYSLNAGGLFGYFGQWPTLWRVLLLTALPLIAVFMIAWFLARGTGLDRRTLTGLSLILGGAVGNLIDRIVRGEVVDFLDVYASSPGLASWLIERFGTAHWPTFNVADSCIVTGACLLMLSIVLPQPVDGPDSTPSGENAPAQR